jgi:AraC-like DNA-binding protein
MTISSTLVRRVDIRFREAAKPLRPYTGCFWVVTADCDGTIRVAPDGTASLFVELQEGRSAEWFLRGPQLRPEERRFDLPTTLIGVRLRPGVAFLLTGMATHSLVDRRISLTSCPALRELVSVDPSHGSHEQCIDALERLLVDRLEHTCVPEVVARALREIERERGCLRVEDLAARCGVGARHLHRLMRTWIGYGAKRYASVIRFQATLGQMQHSLGQSAAALASETGFFDQAHLTVDVARFSGSTPGHLASRCVADFSKTRCDDLP